MSIFLGAWVSSPGTGRCQHTNLLPFTIFFCHLQRKYLMKRWRQHEKQGHPSPKMNPLSWCNQVSFQSPQLQASLSS